MKRRSRRNETGLAAASPSGATSFRASSLKWLGGFLFLCLTSHLVLGQNAARLPQQELKEKEERAIAQQQEEVAQRFNLEIVGNTAFSEKQLRSQLKEQLAIIEQSGLTTARGDDAAFFLELFYKKHGYAKVNVSYRIEGGNRLRLDITEGPLVYLDQVIFVGNRQVPTGKLFDYLEGPTRERYSKAQAHLPFVPGDIDEGVELVQRYYVSQGFAEGTVEPPQYEYVRPDLVVARIVIDEGQRYSFGNINFVGPTIYGPEALRGQMLDLLRQPYTEARLADIPRRLQSYYKTRGYYAVKVDAVGDPTLAVQGRVPVRVTVDPGPVYYFDGITVQGTRKLRPNYLVNRFRKFRRPALQSRAAGQKVS